MDVIHDPVKQASYLQQCLSQDKRPIGLFLAAGCPVSIKTKTATYEGPLIPDIAGLTAVVQKEMEKGSIATNFRKVLEQLKADGNDKPNIEQFLSHIRSLRSVAGTDSVRGLTAAELDQMDDGICGEIVKITTCKLPDSSPYHSLANWIAGIPRTRAVELFTTNYDSLSEQALESSRIPYFDGFVGSNRPFFDPHSIERNDLPARWTRLWKLHGSINWWLDNDGVVTRAEQSKTGTRRVIHPSHLKYEESRRMPYLAMIDRLRAFLREPSAVLVTCGYSFGDAHLNSTILESLQGNSTATLFGLLFGKLSGYAAASSVAMSRGNFNVLSDDGAVIGTRKGTWIQKDSPDEINHKSAVSWIPDPGGKLKSAQFLLGDFARFAHFLSELVGSNAVEKPV